MMAKKIIHRDFLSLQFVDLSKLWNGCN